jgi:hypothetical protein
MNYGDYTTMVQVKTNYLDILGSADDILLADLIHSVSREIDNLTNRHFYPRKETQYYDTPKLPTSAISFDDDLLDLTTLVNGDGNPITVSYYKLYPLNRTPKAKVVVLASSPEQWSTDSGGNSEGAITLAGVFGYHTDYTNAWVATGGTVQNVTSIDATNTSLIVETGKIKMGWLLQIGTEWLYVSAVSVSTTDTVTVARGVNGSTAAIHLHDAPILRWAVDERLEMVARVGVAASYRIRANPVGETIVIDDIRFETPKDITKYMNSRLSQIGVIRTGIG